MLLFVVPKNVIWTKHGNAIREVLTFHVENHGRRFCAKLHIVPTRRDNGCNRKSKTRVTTPQAMSPTGTKSAPGGRHGPTHYRSANRFQRIPQALGSAMEACRSAAPEDETKFLSAEGPGVHLLDMLSVGLIDASWLPQLPSLHAERL